MRPSLFTPQENNKYGLRPSIKSLQDGLTNPNDSKEDTRLHLAALNGNKDKVVALLKDDRIKAGARYYRTGSRNLVTALHLAAYAGHNEVVRLLLDHQEETKSKSSLKAPEGNTLERFGDPRLLDNDGLMAIHYAAAAGKLETLELLLNDKRMHCDPETGEDLQAASIINAQTHLGLSILTIAAANNQPNILKWYLDHPSANFTTDDLQTAKRFSQGAADINILLDNALNPEGDQACYSVM